MRGLGVVAFVVVGAVLCATAVVLGAGWATAASAVGGASCGAACAIAPAHLVVRAARRAVRRGSPVLH
ncbi:MAG TPA: hypothetical protein VFA83_15445 [Acidimicrobiales bacterium]|nr:hypothetical protein [Acidimicrobiales bacterium]